MTLRGLTKSQLEALRKLSRQPYPYVCRVRIDVVKRLSDMGLVLLHDGFAAVTLTEEGNAILRALDERGEGE